MTLAGAERVGLGVVVRWLGGVDVGDVDAVVGAVETLEGVLGVAADRSTVPVERVCGWLGVAVDPDEVGEEVVCGALLRDAGEASRALCVAGGLGAGSLAAGSVTAVDLCGRWGVARSTVQNFTREGLVPRVVRGGAGRGRLHFSPSVVELFERWRGGRVAVGGTRRRVSAEAASGLYARALELRRAHATGDALWGALAAEFGYSVSAVRGVVLGRAAAEGSRAFRARRHPTGRERALISRACGWGVRPSVVAGRYGVSAESVRRIDLEERAERLRVLIRDDAVFSGWAGVDAELGLSDAQLDRVPAPLSGVGGGSAFSGDVRGVVAEARAAGRASAAEEGLLAIAHASALRRAAGLVDGLAARRPDPDALDAAETQLRRVLRYRAALVWLLRRTVVDTVLQALPDGGSGVGVEGLGRAVSCALTETAGVVVSLRSPRFLIGEHARLSGRVSLAVNRAVVRLGVEAEGGAGRASPSFVRVPGWSLGAHRLHMGLAVHPGVGGVLGSLDGLDALLVARRYGVVWSGPDGGLPATALPRRAVAALCGVTTARVMNAERRARALLRGGV